MTTTSDKPFFTTMCVGKVFRTCAEWSNFLAQIPPNGVVLECDGYEWNACDVCINPNTPVDCHLDDRCVWLFQFTIKTAKCPCGAWNYGISYSFGSGGGGFGVRFIADPAKGFPSEKAAIIAALSRLKDQMKGCVESAAYEDSQEPDEDEPKKKPLTPKVKALSKKLDEFMELYNPSQPSLFDMEDWQ